MRKVFLDDLPVKGKLTDWKNSVGCEIKFTYEDIQDKVKIVNYNSKKQILFIKYLDKEPFKIRTGDFSKCKLGKLLGVYSNEFKYKIGDIIKDEKRNIIILFREHRKKEYKHQKHNFKYYQYKCNNCGYDEGWIIESDLQHGYGCPVCCKSPQTIVENINSIVAKEETHWMIPYFQGGYDEAKLYTPCSSQKIYPICPDCGQIKDKSMIINNIYKRKSIGCSKCGDGISYPNKLCFALLEQLGIKFETEYNPEWIKPKKYDFYFELNNNKYIIEMDGGLGHGKKDNSMSGQTKEESKQIDNYKDLKAQEHGIEVIRIDCEISDLDYIKNNILLKLNGLFDLSNINWNQLEEFALGNLVKKICELKQNNPDLTTGDISNKMKLSRATITKYLKQGTKLKWCIYDPQEESRKSNKKQGERNIKNRAKPVEIFKNGIKLNRIPFMSGLELERQSEKLFGVKLDASKISLVCLGKKPQYKGFTFKYIEKITY